MAEPTITEVRQWARVPDDVESGPLVTARATAVRRIRGLMGLDEDDTYPSEYKLATMILATHYFEDRSGLTPEPNVLHLLPEYCPVQFIVWGEKATTTRVTASATADSTAVPVWVKVLYRVYADADGAEDVDFLFFHAVKNSVMVAALQNFESTGPHSMEFRVDEDYEITSLVWPDSETIDEYTETNEGGYRSYVRTGVNPRDLMDRMFIGVYEVDDEE